MTNEQKKLLLENMASLLELPESAYERARDRYEDLGDWFGRDGSVVGINDPHIFPQGSFRLGTAIRPLSEGEAYDLDLACEIQGLSKSSHTQEYLKSTIGEELEAYRKARGIIAPLEAKHRCWRLEYQDHLNFHMDIVPCMPADDSRRGVIFESLRKSLHDDVLAKSVAHLTLSITDDRHPRYREISDDWHISNPEGYATWFESRMNETYHGILEKAQVDAIPVYRRKTPLQRCVQLLKRHRDLMYKDDSDRKPISIIITTLAARAYNGEKDLHQALSTILAGMGEHVGTTKPRVPNPVNPEEDFADRWSRPECRHLRLEDNFCAWLQQVRSDYDNLTKSADAAFIVDQANRKFGIRIDTGELKKRLGLAQGVSVVIPKSHSIETAPPRPWEQETP